ncbi:MAG: Helix-turn-helix domain protein [candidate division BRC1 bacterium ADurb.BinA364]|nr:MAG: Helix-turn-helix domain protein [candidate division BRC1 bacterium ADurb.BinA364]
MKEKASKKTEAAATRGPERAAATSDDLLTLREIAEWLRVNPRTVRRMVDRDKMPAIRVGRQWRFRTDWIDEWLQRGTINRETSES